MIFMAGIPAADLSQIWASRNSFLVAELSFPSVLQKEIPEGSALVSWERKGKIFSPLSVILDKCRASKCFITFLNILIAPRPDKTS